jgi:hypothetical protein
MTTPFTLDYGTLYAHELRQLRRDSDRGIRAFRIRRNIRLHLYGIRNSVTQMTVLLALSFAAITQATA